MQSAFVDSTTVHAVESLFRREKYDDPWAQKLAGDFADLFIYADVIRYPIPVRESTSGYDLIQSDTLLRDLAQRDSQVFGGQPYSTAEPRLLAQEYLDRCIDKFTAWVNNNQRTLEIWLAVHHSLWIQERRLATTGQGYTFSLDALVRNQRFESLTRRTGIAETDLMYAFDSVLKFPLFGELADSQSSRYFNHPIRDAFPLPTMEYEVGNLPPLPLTFRDTVAKLVPNLSKTSTRSCYMN
jgi:hypothetical protein